VRQLRNEVMRLAACARGARVEEEDLLLGVAPSSREPVAAVPVKLQSLKKAMEELERRMIAEALESTRNNQQQAARVLGLSRQGLINKMKRYSLGAGVA
jgi:DNA-binding NtrC family response regulator